MLQTYDESIGFDEEADRIAEVLEIPVGTVKSRMHAAVRRLREMLRDIHEAS